jgi:hypothetical protein
VGEERSLDVKTLAWVAREEGWRGGPMDAAMVGAWHPRTGARRRREGGAARANVIGGVDKGEGVVTA